MDNIICHYTNLSALSGIIENNCLWATNIAFLNDTTEFTHFLRSANERKDQISTSWSSLDREFWDFVRVPKQMHDIPVFVTCFSTADDELTLWRGYSGESERIALIFDRTKLETVIAPAQATLEQCYYDVQELDSDLDSLFEFLHKCAVPVPPDGYNLSPSGSDDNVFHLARIQSDRFAFEFFKLASTHKHRGFKDERETRAIRIAASNYDLDVLRFRRGTAPFIPFIELPLDLKGEGPLIKVRVGPSRDKERTADSISIWLKHKCGLPNVRVDTSDIPFRDW